MWRLVISGLILAARIWDLRGKKRKRLSDTERDVRYKNISYAAVPKHKWN
jgi:hypothetical protein